jgi:multidrug transporter EmrE-like cation transporter
MWILLMLLWVTINLSVAYAMWFGIKNCGCYQQGGHPVLYQMLTSQKQIMNVGNVSREKLKNA